MKDAMYFAPPGIDEVLALLAEHKEKATLLAGGSDLVPKINYYDLKPDILIYTGGIGSAYIREGNGKLIIGAGTTWSDLISNTMVAEKVGALADAARQGGCVDTRNVGTIGGNIVNASPAADLVAPLMALDAEVAVKSAKAERMIPIKDFFTGPGTTILNPDELDTEIHVPFVQGKAVFLKLGRRRAMTLSVVNTAVHLQMDGKICKEARIALGSMAPKPLRCEKAEGILKANSVDKDLIGKCAAEAIKETSPIDDQRATAWYRKKAGEKLVAQALSRAAGIE